MAENNDSFMRLREQRLAKLREAAAAKPATIPEGIPRGATGGGSASAGVPSLTTPYKAMFNTARSNPRTFLGKGGYGSVRSVTKNSKPVALKRMVFEPTAIGTNKISVTPQNIFDQEVATLRDLQKNDLAKEHIVQFLNSGKTDKNGYILTELLSEGGTLDNEIAELDDMDSESFKQLIKNMLTGLDAIHEAGYVHRDIKPSNLWVIPDKNIVKYMDFGLACKMPCARPFMSGTEGYTRIFSAPAANGLYHYGKTEDFYSLIKTLEFMKRELDNYKLKEILKFVIGELESLSESDKAVHALRGLPGISGRKTRRVRRRMTRLQKK